MTVKEFLKLANVNNSIISLSSRDIEEPHYSNIIYEGMDWALLESSLVDLPFKRLFSSVAESLYRSDRIYIEVDVPGLTKDNIKDTEWGRYIPTEEEVHRNHLLKISTGGDDTKYKINIGCQVNAINPLEGLVIAN